MQLFRIGLIQLQLSHSNSQPPLVFRATYLFDLQHSSHVFIIRLFEV